LSDHDAQLLAISTCAPQVQSQKFKTIKKINKYTISDILTKLSYESWDTIFNSDDENIMFNSFLSIYLRIFYSSFPSQKVKSRNNSNDWITPGIKPSCKHKRELYIDSRNSNNPGLKRYYQLYCKILSNVIKEAKKMNYNRKILKSSNKNKTTWDIIKLETGKQSYNGDIQSLDIGGKPSYDQQAIPDSFNNYFSSIVETIHKKNIYNKTGTSNVTTSTPLHFLSESRKNPFPATVFKSFSTKEIITIITSSKSKNSHGYDEVPTKLLKINAPFICSSLTYICNKSILSGNFPDRLKYSIIKPSYKKEIK
jgi:hypothetical protein